tara:strand:+ start:330 stop:518 length:189 start_codon:yes stop_codon:yes gene_type:complete
MKKKYTKFRVLFSTENKMKADKFFDKLKDKEGISIYHRKFEGKDKQRFYVRQVVKQGRKVNA